MLSFAGARQYLQANQSRKAKRARLAKGQGVNAPPPDFPPGCPGFGAFGAIEVQTLPLPHKGDCFTGRVRE